jgi:glycosyltransferase involved in cell wall biosynthesis
MFVGAAHGAPREELRDGVRIVRRGGPLTTRLHAPVWFRIERGAGRTYDIVIEEINTLPWWSSRWAGVPTVAYVHQLAREVWWYEAPRALAALGYAGEPLLLRGCRAGPAIALSESTRSDLVDVGFRPDLVRVVPAAIAQPVPAEQQPREPGLLVYVGRLTRSKRVADLVAAVGVARAAGSDARLVVVGRGTESEVERLRRAVAEAGLGGHVEFAGYLEPDEKRLLVGRAQLVLMASVREGWGLAVTEANALGTPAIVYRRPGLVDSTVDGVTGLVTAPEPAAMGSAIDRVLRDPVLWRQLSAGATSFARAFTYDRYAAAFDGLLHDDDWLARRPRLRPSATPRTTPVP